MGRDRRKSPRLETLEGKQLLSGVHFNHIVAKPVGPMVLNGTLNGSVATFTDIPGPPETMAELFSGRVRAMGRVNAAVIDQLDASGKLIGGEIVLQNRRGSVTLGFGPNSTISGQQAGTITIQVVRYSVVSGTGAYAHASGSGTFTTVQDSGTFTAVKSSGQRSTLVLETTGG